jgi:hypothetical protein
MGRPRTIRPAIIPAGPSIAYIQLTQGLYALVDRDDAELLSQWTWQALQLTPGKFYAGRTEVVDGKQRTVFMARQLLQSPLGKTVDHRYAKTLDNRRSQIRIATAHQNSMNQSTHATRKYKGVTRFGDTQYCRSMIRVNGKLINLGFYPIEQEIEAAKAYDEAAIEHFGEFARTNFPRPQLPTTGVLALQEDF